MPILLMPLTGVCGRFWVTAINNFFRLESCENYRAQLRRQWRQRKQGTHRCAAAFKAVSQLRASFQRGDRVAAGAPASGLLAVRAPGKEEPESLLRATR